MKRSLTLGVVAFAFLAQGAAAQSVVDMSSRNPPRYERGLGDKQAARADDRSERQENWRADASREQLPEERGARFRIEAGQSKIDLQCPTGEPLRDCTEALLQVIDHMRSELPEDRQPSDEGRDRRRYREGS
ncbi:hypothetical protein E2F50_06710 [Rhizobium deserti]|uniref:Uncharacterized protein n=1 Tax=Rhizobium deserti TaxID=2547961 RepID=A0A4R5UIR7_9HYPH|nr:hypothetical protein [Rhizobium deserti]TDK36613.1 hypothetical protein E2F50_06710 [Rhizobium deserti]